MEGWRRKSEPPKAPEALPEGQAKTYAPPGECRYCDERRARAKKSMQALRERGEDA
jgi:hypothetical protein